MPASETMRAVRETSNGKVYQCAALLVCILLGLAMIVNNQLGGEGMWFWYATLFHGGAKLYSGLHTPLQPFFPMLTSAWMRLLGIKCIFTEIPSVVYLCGLCVAIYLVLHESKWPDWQKAVVLWGVFVLTVSGHSYRFDDYHVLAEEFVFYALVALLLLARAESDRRQLGLVAVLGVLCGLTITTRLTDGAALLTAVGVALLFLAPKRKTASAALLGTVAILTVLLVVKLTGDSYSDYVSNTIIKAAASKGGTGSIFAAPLMLVHNALGQLRTGGKKILLYTAAVFLLGALAQRYWKRGLKYLLLLQLGLAALGMGISSHRGRSELVHAAFLTTVVLFLIVLIYLLAAAVAARAVMWRAGAMRQGWDAREVLVLVPLLQWASNSAGAGGEPLTNYYAPMAMLLLLVPVVQPFRRWGSWANISFITVLMLIGLSGMSEKYLAPYAWQNYVYSPMFHDRVWYRHPVYGPLYIDKDLLQFSASVCDEIGAMGPNKPKELLSLPYPYPNYFCAIPPWHAYVQTFFDTSTRATINHMMDELNAAPPQWIVYQRQLKIMSGAEMLYNHGQPIAQRDLDGMILKKIDSGQWTLVDKKNYLEGDGWYIIRTRP